MVSPPDGCFCDQLCHQLGDCCDAKCATCGNCPSCGNGITEGNQGELCDGQACCQPASTTAPACGFAETFVTCRGAAGPCDRAEACTGGAAHLGMSGGGYHNCVLLTDGTAKCWGYNGYGQLGDGSTVTRTTPLPVSGLTGALSLAGGTYHTCAAVAGGVAKCWGNNSFGGLGDGTTTQRNTPVTVLTSAGGAALAGVKNVAGGFHHTCAALSDGTARCWGYNGWGQLGNATVTDSLSPVTVVVSSGGPPLTWVNSLAAGAYHTCALIADGTVKCWGENGQGQLGNGTTSTRIPTPVTVVTTPGGPPLSGVKAISAGGLHTCALLTDGTARCWGANSVGELGTGTTAASSYPVTVTNSAGGALTSINRLAAGWNHTCASHTAGTVSCWGYNAFGQLGNGTTTDSARAVPVSGLASLDFHGA